MELSLNILLKIQILKEYQIIKINQNLVLIPEYYHRFKHLLQSLFIDYYIRLTNEGSAPFPPSQLFQELQK